MDKENKCYIGIDVGSKGFVSVQSNGEWRFCAINENGVKEIHDFLLSINDPRVCVIEHIHAIFGSGAKATFSFGEIFGSLKTLLLVNDIPHHIIQPKLWQKEMWTNADMVYKYKKSIIKGEEVTKKVIDTKATSINACKRIFPNLDLRRNTRCKNIDDNKVDSILMSEYARRKNL